MIKSLIALLLLAAPSFANDRLLLTSDNTATFRGEVTDDSVTHIEVKLIELVKKRGFDNYPIYLVLDTPGGDVDAGNNLIEFLKVTPNIKTVTIFAASMGSAIVEGLPGERLITENGILMFHRAKGQFRGQFETGEVEEELRIAKRVIQKMEKRNADRLGLELQTYKDRVVNEWWLDSDESLSAKAADRKVDIICSDKLVESRVILSISVLIGTVDLSFSECPTLRMPLAPKGD